MTHAIMEQQLGAMMRQMARKEGHRPGLPEINPCGAPRDGWVRETLDAIRDMQPVTARELAAHPTTTTGDDTCLTF